MVHSLQLPATINAIMPKLELDPRWLTPDESAALIGVSRVTFFRMLKRGTFGKLNKRELHARAVYYWQEDLERYRKAMAGPPDADEGGQR